MTRNQERRIEALASTCARRAWRVAFALLRDEHEAWDAVQQAFIVAAAKAERLPRDDAWPWFAQVVVGEARNLRRKRRPHAAGAPREGGPMDAVDPRAEEPGRRLARAELSARLQAALAGLPEAEREALVLVHVAGMSHEEAAQALGRSRSSLTGSHRRGLRRLARRLGTAPDAALGSLALLPVLEPPGGLAAAIESWSAVASAATVTTTAGVGGAAAAGGGVALVTAKPLAVLALAVAAGAGLVAGGATGAFGMFPRRSAPDPTAEMELTPVGVADASPGSRPSLEGTLASVSPALAAAERERDHLALRVAKQEETLATLRDEIDRLRGGVRPTFTFGEAGRLDGVQNANWPELAEASTKVIDGIRSMLAHGEAGEPIPREVAIQVQENVERMRRYEYRTLGKLPTAAKHNGELTHAISIANLLAARLDEAGVPLSEDQIQAVDALGRRFEGELEAVLAGPGPRVRRLLEEYRLKQRFMDALYRTFSEAQKSVVIDTETHRLASLDLYDPSLILIHTSPLIAADTADGIVANLHQQLVAKYGLDEAAGEQLDPLLASWRARITPALTPVPGIRLKHYGPDVADLAGAATVELVDALLRDLALSEDQRKVILEDPAIYVPRLTIP